MNKYQFLLNELKKKLYLHIIRNIVGYSSWLEDGSRFPKSARSQALGLTRIPYLLKFSKVNRRPPRIKSKNPQLTRPS